MENRPVFRHASSLLFYCAFAAIAVGCSSTTPRVVAAAPLAAHTAEATPEPATTAAPVNEAKPEPPPARDVDEVLAGCQADGKKCSVSPDDAAEICRAMNPTVALHVFANNKKLRVGFLTRDMEAWSTTQSHATKTRARFDEEVLVLAKRKAKGTVIVQGAAETYEVLRWDGSCASLMGDEITFRRAPRPVRPVKVDRLHLPVQAKLANDARIHAALDRADTACQANDGSVACDVARRSFGDAVATRAPRLGL